MRRSVTVVASSFLALAACPAAARASKPVPNFAYVQSGPGGVFYARCVPAEAQGARGATRIYRVGKDRDELLDTYGWYAKEGVVLAWSPIAGKVAAMALGGGGGGPAAAAEPGERVELGFYLGGAFLNAYTTKDLKAWGADAWHRGGGGRALFRVLGQEQIPGTNEYLFCIEIKGKKFCFDVLTGKPYAGPAAGPPRATGSDVILQGGGTGAARDAS